MNRSLFMLLSLLLLTVCPGVVLGQETLPIRAAFVRVLEQAEVPAAERGAIASISVKLGDGVEVGQELARLDDSESRVALKLAELDAQIAVQQAASDLAVKVAEAAVREAQLDQKRAALLQEIAEKQAASTAAVLQAQRTQEVRRKALDRALAARKGYRPSVSEAELEQRQLEFDLADQKLIQARIDAEIAALKARVERAAVEQFVTVIHRLSQQAAIEQNRQAIAAIQSQVKARTVDLARIQLEKRQVRSPLRGSVVELLRQRGEWVEAGTPILRVIRLDRLRVEGFVDAARNRSRLVGSEVRISSGDVRLPGVVTHVSPEVDSVNNQVLVHVEFDNAKQLLLPGEPVTAEIVSGVRR